ncbi:Response regulator PleD [compost metagenome]
MVTAIVLSLVSIVLRRYQARIAALATTDQLTELLNRRGFDLLANQAIQEARRNPSPLCALLLDLDNFKDLNDSHGHLAGDEVLRGFANKLRDNLRQSDIICRWGGEEFILLLKDTSPEQARLLAEKIRQQTAQNNFSYQGASLHITTSIGLAELHPDDSLSELLARTDRALYRAKQSGRNRTCEASA